MTARPDPFARGRMVDPVHEHALALAGFVMRKTNDPNRAVAAVRDLLFTYDPSAEARDARVRLASDLVGKARAKKLHEAVSSADMGRKQSHAILDARLMRRGKFSSRPDRTWRLLDQLSDALAHRSTGCPKYYARAFMFVGRLPLPKACVTQGMRDAMRDEAAASYFFGFDSTETALMSEPFAVVLAGAAFKARHEATTSTADIDGDDRATVRPEAMK